MTEEKSSVLAMAAALGGEIKEYPPGKEAQFSQMPPAGDEFVMASLRTDGATEESISKIGLALTRPGTENALISVSDTGFDVFFPGKIARVDIARAPGVHNAVRVHVQERRLEEAPNLSQSRIVKFDGRAPRKSRLFAGEAQALFEDAATLMLKLARDVNADRFPWSHAPRVRLSLLEVARHIESLGNGKLPAAGGTPGHEAGTHPGQNAVTAQLF